MTTQAENKIDEKEVIETTNSPVTSDEKTKAVTNSPQNSQSSEVIEEQLYTVPSNAKRPLSVSDASPEPKRSRVDGWVPKSTLSHENPNPTSSSPAPSNEKINPSPEGIMTPAGIPHQPLDWPMNKQSEIPYSPERRDIKRIPIIQKRSDSEILRRNKEIVEMIALRRQRDDEENEQEWQDQPYEPPCEVCLQSAIRKS